MIIPIILQNYISQMTWPLKDQGSFLGTNCEKVPLFRVVRKKWKKTLFKKNSIIQICTRLLWKCVEKIQKLWPYKSKDYNVWS